MCSVRTSIAGLHVRRRRSRHSFRQHELKSISEVWLSSGRARLCCLGLLHVFEELGRQHAEGARNLRRSLPGNFLRAKSPLRKILGNSSRKFTSLSAHYHVVTFRLNLQTHLSILLAAASENSSAGRRFVDISQEGWPRFTECVPADQQHVSSRDILL